MTATDTISVSRSVVIAAAPERVWEAITEPEHIAKWASFVPSIDRVAVGGSGAWVLPTYGPMPITIEAIDEPRSITYRWGPRGGVSTAELGSTVFTFTLRPMEAGTELTVVESGFEVLENADVEAEAHRNGWVAGLESLAAVLEGRK